MDLVVKRFEIYFVNLDPTQGSEIKKIIPCVVISPNEMNKVLKTIIVAPLTSTIRNYPSRVNCLVAGKSGQIALDQLRVIDKQRLGVKLSLLDDEASVLALKVIAEMFAY